MHIFPHQCKKTAYSYLAKTGDYQNSVVDPPLGERNAAFWKTTLKASFTDLNVFNFRNLMV